MGIVVVSGQLGQYGISVREVEHHHIPALYAAETGQTSVVAPDEVRIGLSAENGVVDKRYGKRSLRQFGAIGQLAYKQVVTGHQGTLHGRGGNPESLEEEDIEGHYHNYGEDYGIEPVQPYIVLLPFLIVLLPECPFYLPGDKDIENHEEAEKPPVISEPYHPEQVQDTPDSETEPLIMQELFHVR